jgi:hypothetical protein
MFALLNQEGDNDRMENTSPTSPAQNEDGSVNVMPDIVDGRTSEQKGDSSDSPAE